MAIIIKLEEKSILSDVRVIRKLQEAGVPLTGQEIEQQWEMIMSFAAGSFRYAKDNDVNATEDWEWENGANHGEERIKPIQIKLGTTWGCLE